MRAVSSAGATSGCMTIQAFLATTTGTEKQDWQQTVAILVGSGQAVVLNNVRTESRLDADAWESVVAVLPRSTWAEIQAVTTLAFRGHTLNGDEIAGTPSPKGRALTVERFKALLKESGLYPTDADADQFVRDLQTGSTPPFGFARQLTGCPLGSYHIWSTFDDTTAGGDPFDGCTGSPGQIRHAFGLVDPGPAMPDEREFVLCVYDVPSGVPVRFPTIADAYAGDDWNPNFQCSPAGASWGTTSGGRPEVVHAVIGAETLTAPPAVSGVLPLRLVS